MGPVRGGLGRGHVRGGQGKSGRPAPEGDRLLCRARRGVTRAPSVLGLMEAAWPQTRTRLLGRASASRSGRQWARRRQGFLHQGFALQGLVCCVEGR